MNTAKVKKQVENAINKLPTTVNLMRQTKVSDGTARGYTLGQPQLVTTFKALLDNSAMTHQVVVLESAKVTRARSIKMIVLYDSAFQILEGDYFDLGGKTYRVTYVDDILKLQIYWECELEVVSDGTS